MLKLSQRIYRRKLSQYYHAHTRQSMITGTALAHTVRLALIIYRSILCVGQENRGRSGAN